MKSAIQKPTRLDQARERLDRAVARLEAALATGGGNGGRAAGLAEKIRAFERENVALKEINAIVGRRLDSTITKLKDVMKE